VDSKSSPEDESELLFLLGSLKHRNIVELVAAYVHDGTYNLLFLPADMDLGKFLDQPSRPTRFEKDRSILKALHGLSSGLRHLHRFESSGGQTPEDSTLLYGTHQDIKPSNILVRGTDFILADFGLSRLSPVEEGSQTTWKDATYEYGAPECQDRITWSQGRIGRASDIWSLGCIVSEVMVYMRNGLEGVQKFRDCRSMQGLYGTQRAFHDGTHLQELVREALAEFERDTGSPALSGLFELLMEIFAELPTDRPNAKQVESRLQRTILQALTQDLSDVIAKLRAGTETNVFQVTLYLESTRFRAWAVALDLIPVGRQRIDVTAQIPLSFPELCETLEGAIESIEAPPLFEAKERNQSFILSTIRQCNDTIYQHLPEALRESANGFFPILFNTDISLQSLSLVKRATLQEGYEDTCRIAAMKYMSSLYSQNSGDFGGSSKLEQSLIEKDMLPDNLEAHPEIYWYNAACPKDQKQKVHVEWRDYGKKLDGDLGREEVQRQVDLMFRRIQGLVAMLRQPKSSNFRVMDCLGAFHDPEDQRFGIVYGFPQNRSTSIRLHYLLKGGGSKGLRQPHIGQKFTLAKTLAACLQAVHLSGWIHKDINSYNILFFTSGNQPSEEEYRTPSLIGFQYSRENERDAYTSGPAYNDETRQYQHPCYREGSASFRREFDYYSLGVVLWEIGVWECLNSVDKNRVMSPSKLRDKCISICGKQILERMGPIYKEVVMTCLEAESQLSGAEADVAMDFQKDVIEKLESCRV
jgi:serine/threonine protein kinase